MIHIGVNLSDGDFAFALARGLSRNSGKLQVHLDNIGDCDLILSDDERYMGKDNVLYLSDKTNIHDSANRVYRYADCREINSKIFERLKNRGFDSDGVSDGKGNYSFYIADCGLGNNVISFVGNSGGAGVTSAMISISKILWEVFNKKILYLNLQSKDNSETYFGHSNGKAKTQQLLYYLRNGIDIKNEEYIVSGIPSYILREEIDDFIYYATKDEIFKLLATINDEGYYDYIFLDLGTELFIRNIELLKFSDGVVEIRKNVETWKTCALDNLVDIPSQRMIIENFSTDKSRNNDRIQSVSSDRDAFLFRNGIQEIELNTAYGNDMWKFTHKFEGIYG